MVMGHNYLLPEFLPLNEIEIVSGPKAFGGKREGWWTISYREKKYKIFASVIDLDEIAANRVRYHQLNHIKKLAAESLVLKTAQEI